MDMVNGVDLDKVFEDLNTAIPHGYLLIAHIGGCWMTKSNKRDQNLIDLKNLMSEHDLFENCDLIAKVRVKNGINDEGSY